MQVRLLPNAPLHPDMGQQAWFTPKALPNPMKPRVPGHEEDENGADDEEGIMKSVDIVDQLVQAEIDRGVDPSRIIVGGFSQGCAISLVWGLTGKTRFKVGGVVCLAGYFPLVDRIPDLRRERGFSSEPEKDNERKKWLYQHGKKDLLVSTKLFTQGQQQLAKWVHDEDVRIGLYEGMGHSAGPAALRDLLEFLEQVIPP